MAVYDIYLTWHFQMLMQVCAIVCHSIIIIIYYKIVHKVQNSA